jgi:hypothetical protein
MERRFRGWYYLHQQAMALIMEAVRTSETSDPFNLTTWRYYPEDSTLHSRRHENLKSHILQLYIILNLLLQQLESETIFI